MVQRKKILIVLFAILVLSTSPALAQSGFRRLPPGKLAIGMGYQRYQPPTRTNAPFRFYAQTLLGNLEYAFSRDLKLSLLPGVSFFDVVTQNPYEIAPSPSIDIRLLNVNNMNMTGLKFFILGGFRTQYMNVIRTGDLPLNSVNMALRGGAGFLHLLETDYDWSLKPFFGMFYTQSWNNVSTTRAVHVNTSQNFFTGETGVEIELSPTMSAIGSLEFSFESSELLYRFGLNFYQPPASAVASEISSLDTSEIRETGSRTPSDENTIVGGPEVISESGEIDYAPNIEVAGPQYKFKVDPEYPSLAKETRQQGEVILEAIINEDGIPVDIVPRTFFGAGLEAAAMEALKQTRFYPAIYRGAPIPTRVAIRYKFILRGISESE
jgi:TonB family protein